MARTGTPPNYIQLNDYGATMHYLRAVKAAGTDEATAVMKKMRETKINDMITKDGWIREDGRVIRDAWLVQVKTPEESKTEWDMLKIVARIPAADSIRPLDKGGCPLVKDQLSLLPRTVPSRRLRA
jgi:branched-chain amino acid transport system substrate-binding protein